MEETRRGKGGREEPEETTLDEATKDYNAGQPLDGQRTRKLKAGSVEASGRRRKSKQEQRDGNRQQKVLWEKSLSVQNGQRKRRKRDGGAGQ